MDMKELRRSMESNSALRAAADGLDAGKLLRNIDAASLEKAAETGDAETLKSCLQQVLSTPEGRALAQRVRKAVGPHG